MSLVLPSYRSSGIIAERVPILHDYLRSLQISYEIIIVDDGSHDGGDTQKIANKLKCVYVAIPFNKGKGQALRAGMNVAKGKYRIFTDADIPYELKTIERFLWYLDFKEFHIVVGDRTLKGSSYFESVPLTRRLGSRLLSFFVGRFFIGGWFDTQCGFKGFRDHIAEDLFGVSRINRFAVDIELLYVAQKRNYDIKKLPVTLENQGVSTVRPVWDGLQMIADIWRIRWNNFMGRYRALGKVSQPIDSYSERKLRLGRKDSR